jgi:hypothetical protein
MKYIITCYPFPNGKNYLLQFSISADSKEEAINYCEERGIYYKTIVSLVDYAKMNYFQLPLHEIENPFKRSFIKIM